MAEAYILKNGTVVRSDGWTNLRFSITTGMLTGFTNRTTKYIHVRKKDFRIRADNNLFSAGYYPEYEFLKYLNTRDLDLIKNEIVYDNFTLAEDGDQIEIRKLIIINETNSAYEKIYETSIFSYDKSNYPVVFNNNGSVSIQIPIEATKQFDGTDAGETGEAFYENNRLDHILGNSILSDDEKNQAALYLARSSFVIENIINRIFTIFPNETLFNDLVIRQKEYWTTGDLFSSSTPSLSEFENFNSEILTFYAAARSNTHAISTAQGAEKLYWLVISMPTSVLSLLSLENKKSILKTFLNNESEVLSTIFVKEKGEKLVLKIIQSFSFDIEDNKLENIDSFLEWLITERKETGTENYKTFYELFYDRMSSSFNMRVFFKLCLIRIN